MNSVWNQVAGDHPSPDDAPDRRQVQAAYEAGIEAFIQRETCRYELGGPLHAAWSRGFEDACRDLSSVWRDTSSTAVPPELEAMVRRMSPAERRAMIVWLSTSLDQAAG